MDIQFSISIEPDELKNLIKEQVMLGIAEFFENKELLTKEEDKLLSRAEVMEMQKISEITLLKLQKSGKIPFTKFGRRVLFSRQEVLESISKIENSWRNYG